MGLWVGPVGFCVCLGRVGLRPGGVGVAALAGEGGEGVGSERKDGRRKVEWAGGGKAGGADERRDVGGEPAGGGARVPVVPAAIQRRDVGGDRRAERDDDRQGSAAGG